MKTKVLFPANAAATLTALLFCFSSCLLPVPADVEPAVLRLGLPETRATTDPFATDDYILTLTSSDGKTAFRGLWGERPDEIELAHDTYAISMLSSTFKDPEFD